MRVWRPRRSCPNDAADSGNPPVPSGTGGYGGGCFGPHRGGDRHSSQSCRHPRREPERRDRQADDLGAGGRERRRGRFDRERRRALGPARPAAVRPSPDGRSPRLLAAAGRRAKPRGPYRRGAADDHPDRPRAARGLRRGRQHRRVPPRLRRRRQRPHRPRRAAGALPAAHPLPRPERARSLPGQSGGLPVVSDPLARRLARGGGESGGRAVVRTARPLARRPRRAGYRAGADRPRRLQPGDDDGAPRRPAPKAALAGIVGFSGRLLEPERLAAELGAAPPVLLIHGDADPVVPFASLEEAAKALDAAGSRPSPMSRAGLATASPPTGSGSRSASSATGSGSPTGEAAPARRRCGGGARHEAVAGRRPMLRLRCDEYSPSGVLPAGPGEM